MKRITVCAIAVGSLGMPALAQFPTVFMAARPGPGVDVSDPLNPKLAPGSQIVVEALLDGTTTPALYVTVFDLQLGVDDSVALSGSLTCQDITVDEMHQDRILHTCNFCSGSCIAPLVGAVAGIDFACRIAGNCKDIDFVGYLAEITLEASVDAEGTFTLGYVGTAANNVIGSGPVKIIDAVNNPDSFIPLTITVVELPGACCLERPPGQLTCSDELEDDCINTIGGTWLGPGTACDELDPLDPCDCNGNGILDDQDIADCTGDLACSDCNNNGVPDGCEIDSDGDGIPDACDVCRFDVDPQQDDSDNDGVGDVCDNCPLTPNGPDLGTCIAGLPGELCSRNDDCNFQVPGECSQAQEDSDGDGVGDACQPSTCGDGITQNPNDFGESEECDDGGTANGDGCDEDCVREICGNGKVQPGSNPAEECDDGNNDRGDGCDPFCVTEFCGDGIRNNVTEECDDGGTADGDGCSATCQFEGDVPTVSEWSMAALATLLLIGLTVKFRRRSTATS